MCTATEDPPPIVLGYCVARDQDRFALKEYVILADRMELRAVRTFATQSEAREEANRLADDNEVLFLGVET